MATEPSSLSKPKGGDTAPSGQAGAAARPSDTGAPRSFITPAFPQAEAMGPGATFAAGSASPSLGGKREPERAGFAAKPIRGNRKRVRKLSEPNPYSYSKAMEERSRGESLPELSIGEGFGQNGKAGQPLSAPGNDTNAQILEIIRRRQQEAKPQAKTTPQASPLKQPDMAVLRMPDGNTPRNLLESAQALAAQRKAREAASPAAQPTGLQPAVFRPGQQQQPAGFGQSNQGGIVQAQAPMPTPFGPVPMPPPILQPGQGTMPRAEEINRATDWLGKRLREGMQQALPLLPAGQAFLLGQALLQGLGVGQSQSRPSDDNDGAEPERKDNSRAVEKADGSRPPEPPKGPQGPGLVDAAAKAADLARQGHEPFSRRRTADGREMMTIGEGSEVEVSGNPEYDRRLRKVLEKTQGRDSYECIKVVLNGGKVTTDEKAGHTVTELRKPGWKEAADRDFRAAIEACKGDPSKIRSNSQGDVLFYQFEDGVSFIRRDFSKEGLPTVEIQIHEIHPSKNIELKMRFEEMK